MGKRAGKSYLRKDWKGHTAIGGLKCPCCGAECDWKTIRAKRKEEDKDLVREFNSDDS